MSLAPFHEVDLAPFTDILQGTHGIIAKLASGVADKEKRNLITGLADAVGQHRADFLKVVPAGIEQARSRYESLCQEHTLLLSQIREIQEKKARIIQDLQAKVVQSPASRPPTPPAPNPPKAIALPDFHPAEDLRAELLGLGHAPTPTLTRADSGPRTSGNIWENWKSRSAKPDDQDHDDDQHHENDHEDDAGLQP
jgi:hypothetical protein